MAGQHPMTGVEHIQRAQIPELTQEYNLSAPLKGLMDGLDPALMDSLYPPLFSPDMENVRTTAGRFEVRLGTTADLTLPGSGNPRWLDNLYQSTLVTPGGQVTRLAARGTGAAGQLYEFKVESDVAYQAVSGGGSLGSTTQPYFQGTTIGDAAVLTDRTGALKKYTRAAASPGVLAAVTNGAAPAAAPVVVSRWFDKLETWTTPANWAASAGGHFTVTDTTAASPPPGGGHSVNALVVDTGANGATLTPTVTGTALPSHSIAFWLYQRIDAKAFVQMGIGINNADEFTLPLQTTVRNNWYPFFFNIGDIGTINFLRMLVLDASQAPNGMLMSPLYLPGRLEGTYRWIYTYYTVATGIESAPSPISNGGVALDFSAIGITNDGTTGRAFQKAASLRFTHNPSGANKIRVYRSGGAAELTQDANGFDVWYRVGEIFDVSTTLNGAATLATNSITLTSAANIAVGDTLVLDPGLTPTGTAGGEEYVTVTSIASAPTLTVKGRNLDGKTQYSHLSGAVVQIALVDNTPNELIDTTSPVDLARQDPPAGALFVQRSPEGRLWIFGYKDNPTGVAVSNRATPDRTADYYTFPDGIDPLTRRQVNQGWRFKVGGDNTDEAIVWGGFYQGQPYILTKRHLYVVTSQSQLDWGTISIQKVLDFGCIAGDSVCEVNEYLYWVTDGPRVVRWSGRSTSPEIVSHLRVNERLRAAPGASWSQWYARPHTKERGRYYGLTLVPAGQTTPVQRLDYNADADAWEPVVYYDGTGTPIAIFAANVREGGSDLRDLFQVDGNGQITKTEAGTTDAGVPITFHVATKKIPLAIYSRYPSGALGDVSPGATRHLLLGQVAMATQLFYRFAAVNDTITVTVTTGGAEYGVTTHTYTRSLAGTTDREIKERLHRDLYGRWCQVTFSGSVSNGPAIRESVLWALPIRAGSIRT